MLTLRNIREQHGPGGVLVFADFTAPDGRLGSVSVPAEEFRAYGEVVLMQQAEACCAQARGHGYRAPGLNRFDELR